MNLYVNTVLCMIVGDRKNKYVGWLVVFNVPSTARSFTDSTPILLSLAKDVKLDKYTVPTGN